MTSVNFEIGNFTLWPRIQRSLGAPSSSFAASRSSLPYIHSKNSFVMGDYSHQSSSRGPWVMSQVLLGGADDGKEPACRPSSNVWCSEHVGCVVSARTSPRCRGGQSGTDRVGRLSGLRGATLYDLCGLGKVTRGASPSSY